MKAFDKFGQAREVPSREWALDHGLAPIPESDPLDVIPFVEPEEPEAGPWDEFDSDPVRGEILDAAAEEVQEGWDR